MSDKTSSPGEAGAVNGGAADPAAARPGGPLPGEGESIIVSPEVLSQIAAPVEPREPVKDEEPQVFASTVRRQELSEAGYDENPPGAGKLGVILGTVLALLLVGSGVTLYMVNRPDSSAKAKAADSAPTSAAPTADPVPPIKDTAKVLPTVTGDFGKKPTIEVPKEAAEGTFVVKQLSEGDGPKVNKNDWVSVDFSAKDWANGKDIAGSYDQGKPQLYQAGSGKLIPALDSVVTGHKAGSRLLVVAPPAAAFGAQGNSAMGVGATDNLVFVIDIKQATAPDATVQGEMTDPPSDFPKVKDNGKKAAEITPVPGAADPKELKTAVLIQGKGKKVESGEKVVVQYTGVLYKDGKKFDSSLDRGQAFSFVTGGGSVIEGWDKGIVGQTVGSRIELVIPSSLGYKDQASGPIPANSTLVFVVDILDAGVGSADS
ncbi:putative peptidyl-prolyl cis-trans isomerase FKBP-type [Kitasatospora sp. MMS16-BH015]|uniref:FKBP-type peptidyl-prolyl cis-trans isomerase n=1 Tax=Kitasatospora sp. MMS16-BH015 TaxID=2018025 RepID=UPI000CA119F3|nr:FKBP-type peptidyl-prolyl cis-trans isomerase [Kitasatospora sp. MMS16-BH015]AUG76212.1 putative peptidyl-prolyl cis-trans isomerase FKBP-type [Kitasatospora sp. MMS16-BH015]